MVAILPLKVLNVNLPTVAQPTRRGGTIAAKKLNVCLPTTIAGRKGGQITRKPLNLNLPTTTTGRTGGLLFGGHPFRLDSNLPIVTIATKILITAQPNNVFTNTAFSLTVNATDNSNNLSSTYSSSATVTMASFPAGAHLTGTTTANFSGGILTFSNLLVDTVGTYTLTISSGSLTPATTIAFTVNSPYSLGTATHLHWFQNPGGAAAGALLSPQPIGQAQDGANSTATGFTYPMQLVIKSGTGTAGAVLGGTTTKAPSSGITTWTDITIDRAGTGYVLTLSAPGSGLASIDSPSFTIT